MDILSGNWEDLRNNVKRCGFTDCPRNRDKTPIFFERGEGSLSKVKFLVLSQEPGANLRNEVPSGNPDEIEDYLIGGCEEVGPAGNSPVNKIVKIFCHNFSPSTDEIYWTHALKCVPQTSNHQIKSDWGGGSKYCEQHLINELKLLPNLEWIVTLGKYAFKLIKRVGRFNHEFPDGIKKVLAEVKNGQEFLFQNRKLLVFPFLHPANENRNHTELTRENEKRLIQEIRTILKKECF